MPLCTLHLVRLAPSTDAASFLRQLLRHVGASSTPYKLVTASRVRRPIIRANRLDNTLLNSTPWDLLLVLAPKTKDSPPPPVELPPEFQDATATHYSLCAGIPTKIVDNYVDISTKLNNLPVPPLTKLHEALKNVSNTARSDSQHLELSQELLDLATHLKRDEHHTGSVSMLNLMHFYDTKDAVEQYHAYGKGFAEVGGKRGGNAKLVGVVVKPPAQADSRGKADRDPKTWWNECSLVHYPSIDHFCDMSADEEYQRINREHRLGVRFVSSS